MSAIFKIYAKLIKNGEKSIEDVPEHIRLDVQRELNSLDNKEYERRWNNGYNLCNVDF